VPTIGVSVDSETYARLSELARERGLSVGLYVKELILEHLKGSGGTPAGQAGLEFEARISSLEAKLRELEEIKARVAKLEELLSKPQSTAQNTPSSESGTRVYCKAKSEIKNVGSYVRKLEHDNKLVDWWDEGERYCFEVREG